MSSPDSYDLVTALFHYTPSYEAAITFMELNIVIICGVIYTVWKYRNGGYKPQQGIKQVETISQSQNQVQVPATDASMQLDRRGVRLLWIVAITSSAMIIGLGLRIEMLKNASLTVFIVQQALLIISPNALAFVNYSLLGIILSTSEHQDISLVKGPFYLRSKWVSRLFLASDVFAFIIQSSSTPMLTDANPDTQNNGKMMMIGGLILQLIFFTMFTAIAVYVDRKATYVSTRPVAMNSLFNLLYFTIIMLYIRSIYRLIEFAQGYDGEIARMEWLFYVADQIPVSAAMIAYIAFRPVRSLQYASAELAAAAASTDSNNKVTVIVQSSSTVGDAADATSCDPHPHHEPAVFPSPSAPVDS